MIKTGDWQFDVSLNLSNYRNNIVALDENVLNSYNKDFTYTNGTYLTRLQEDNSFGSIYGFRYKGVYQYALAFANMGYVGDPLVLALFGEEVLSYYKLACLPYSLVIYTWGISALVPQGEKKGNPFKNILNAPTIAMFIGVAVGLICGAFIKNVPTNTTAFDVIFPSFIISTLDTLKACMGPVAMLLAGFTIARYDLKTMLQNKKVYVATTLRLIVIPIIILSLLFGVKELVNAVFSLSIDNTPLILIFFAIAAPLGLNTVVFPEAYGGDPKTGASMAMISHTLCVLTIPLMFALISALLGGNTSLPL
jgi:predicted permease